MLLARQGRRVGSGRLMCEGGKGEERWMLERGKGERSMWERGREMRWRRSAGDSTGVDVSVLGRMGVHQGGVAG